MRPCFSPSTSLFYDRDIHDDAVPDDAIDVSPARFQELVANRARGATITIKAGKPVARTPDTPIAERRRLTIRRIKRESGKRIEQIAPAWRQSNDNATIALAALGAAASEHDLAAAIKRRAEIDAIRIASDRLESAIHSMSAASLASLDIADPQHWPQRTVT